MVWKLVSKTIIVSELPTSENMWSQLRAFVFTEFMHDLFVAEICWFRAIFLPLIYTVVQKNAPTLADYNYDPVQSILIIFSKLFVNNHKRCLVVKFSTSPHICCHYTLWNTMLYFALLHCLSLKMCQLRMTITSISVKENSPDLNPVDYRIWGLMQ